MERLLSSFTTALQNMEERVSSIFTMLKADLQIQMFIKHWRTPSNISTLLRICLHWWQFVAGISTPILEDTRIKLPHLDEESKLISSMRHYLGSINAQIEADDPGVPPPQRENDVPFMEAVLNDPNFSTTDKKYTNRIRMFHNVFWVSDIAKADVHYAVNTDSTCW